MHLALSGAFPDTIESIRDRFAGLLPADRVHVFDVLSPVPSEPSHPARIASEICREAFLARLDPHVVHISSLIEGTREDSVSSVGRLGLDIPTSATFYDAIPFIHRSHYLAEEAASAWYEERVDQLRRVDLLLSISQSSAQEAVEYLKVDEARVLNVGTAADPVFQPRAVSEEFLSRFGIYRPFVMYTGGIDFRKNIEGMLAGFAALPRGVQSAHQLVIACSCGPEEMAKLMDSARRFGLLGDTVVLTGAIDDLELAALYSAAKVFVFPSLHEGFGLPILEAMQCGTAVLGSNCSSMPEVIGLEEALFDPRGVGAIRDVLNAALTNEELLRRLKANSKSQAAKFSWDNVGQTAITAFEGLHQQRQGRPVVDAGSRPKKRLAWVSPIPPARSGIAAYSRNLLPELGHHYDIDVIVDGDDHSNDLPGVSRIIDAPTFLEQSDRYDRVVYQFGNSEFHDYMLPLVEAVPGVVVLHDFYIGGLIRHRAVREGGEARWLAALYENHGAAAVADCVRAETRHESALNYPCCATVVSRSLGLTVHSDFAGSLARKWLTPEWARRVNRIQLPCPNPPTVEGADARRRLELPSDALLVCSFGLMGPTKCNLDILAAWINSRSFQDPGTVLVFVGAPACGEYGNAVAEEISNRDLEHRVRITGWTDDRTYRDYLAACDIAIQLRTDSRGEASLALLDCLACGVPTIANANGSNAELPNSILSPIPDRYELAQLSGAIDQLRVAEKAARQMGEAARRHIATVHAPAEVAQHFHDQMEAIYGRSADLAEALAPLFPSLSAEDAARLAAIAADSIFLPSSRTVSLDVSELENSLPSGQRFRALCDSLLPVMESFPQQIRLELVRFDAELGGYMTAHRLLAELLGLSRPVLPDTPAQFFPNDLLICPDSRQEAVCLRSPLLQDLRRKGLQIMFVIDDLRDESLQHLPSPTISEIFAHWLHALAQSNGVACSSESLASELRTCLGILEDRPLPVIHVPGEQGEAIRYLVGQLAN